MAANVVLLDRVLTFYGPGSEEARSSLREALLATHDEFWASGVSRGRSPSLARLQNSSSAVVLRLQGLAPTTEIQRGIQSNAMQLAQTIGQLRLLMLVQLGVTVPWPVLTLLTFWVCMLFLGFGLFARLNPTIAVTLLVGSVSVAGAVFLILELSQPYAGLLRLSDDPILNALAQIGR